MEGMCRSRNRLTSPWLPGGRRAPTSALPGLALHALLQEGKHGSLFGRKGRQRFAKFPLSAALDGFRERAVHVGIDHGGMHIALPADRLRISQTFGDALDGRSNVALGSRLRIELLEPLQGLRG